MVPATFVGRSPMGGVVVFWRGTAGGSAGSLSAKGVV